MATPGEQAAAEGPQNVCQVEEPQEQPIGRPIVQHDRVVKERNRGGYECEFVQTPLPDSFQTECSVCLEVLRDVHLTICCGHNFCKECIERVQKAEKSCPLCNKERFTVTYNRAHDVALKQFEVYCTHRKIGCEWKGRLEVLDKHLNVNPELEKQLQGCTFVEVQCYHDGCGQYCQRHLIANHQSENCSERPFSCDYCRDYNSTQGDVLFNHLPVCKCYPVSCPHECTPYAVERQKLEKHLNEECPLQEVECVFKYAGCETKLPRKDMPEHLKENIGHMSLLARQNQALARQNQELMAKLLEKDEQIRRMMEENRIEMKDGIERLAIDQDEKRERLKQEQEEQVRRMVEENQRLEKDQQKKLEGLKDSLEKLHHHVQIVMTNFEQHKRDKDRWSSEGFYTHPQGYNMCLRVDANGKRDGAGTHVACFVYLMRGDSDNLLKWPFRGSVTIQLLNQREDNNHRSKAVLFSEEEPNVCNSRVTDRERATSGWGCNITPHSELGYTAATNCQYLMNDRLYFRVKVELPYYRL